jgi:hypothetical protein
VLYPAVDVMASAAAELGAPRGTPYFPDTVVDDHEIARLLRAPFLVVPAIAAAVTAGLRLL